MKALNKYFLLLLCFSLVSWSMQGQLLIDEDFESGALPAGWVTASASGTAAPWAVGTSNAGAIAGFGGANYLFVDSDANGNGNHMIETVTTSAFDATGYAQVLLEFDHHFRETGTASVEVFDGTTWQNVATYTTNAGDPFSNPPTSVFESIDVTAHANAAMQVRFHYDDGDVWNWWWNIDNVQVKGINCPDPTAVSVTNVTATSADVNFTSASGLTNVVVTDVNAGTSVMHTGLTMSPLSLTGLNPQTDYDVTVIDSCGAGDNSIGVMESFTTPCLAFVAPVTTDMEGTNVLCWEQDQSDDMDWILNSGGTPSGGTGPSGDHTPGLGGAGNYLFIESSNNGAGDQARIYAQVDLSGLTSPNFTMWYHMFGGNTGTLELEVEFPAGSGTFISLWSTSGDQGDQWLEVEQSLIGFFQQTIGLRITATSGGFTTSDIAIDDVVIKEAPTCPKPTNFAATNLIATGGDLSWTPGMNSMTVASNIEYGVAPLTPGMGTAIIGATNPQPITGLMGNTTYDAYIVDSCGVGDLSDTVWTSFTTPCAAFVAPFAEDWENAANQLCWVQDQNDDREWIYDQNGTPSNNTGPSGDHTPGLGGSGTYIFTETSGVAAGQTANLHTQVDLSALTTPELTFWYHMFGTTMGTLNIDVESPVGSGTWTNVWTLSGNQGDVWTLATVDLSAYSGTIGFRIQGISGGSYTSDMAVDDLDFHEQPSCVTATGLNITTSGDTVTIDWVSTNVGATYDIEIVPAGAPQGSGTVINTAMLPYVQVGGLASCSSFDVYASDNCGGGLTSFPLFGSFTTPPAAYITAPYGTSFEDGGALNACWTQDPNDDFDWTVDDNGTPSTQTGPSVAATGQYYVYIETSGGVGTGDSATLISPAIVTSGLTSPGLAFNWHMFGSTMGTLNVKVESPAGSGNMTNVWSMSGDQGDVWNLAELPLTGFADTIAVHFTGIDGNGYRGDLAIDNFFVGEINCFTPSGFNIDFLASDSIAVSWNGDPTDTFQVGVAFGGVIQGSQIIVGPQLAGPVPPETTFEFFIREICGPGDTSQIAGPFSITTPCGNKIAPWVESFEDGGALDICWTQDSNDDFDWTVDQNGTPSGGTGPGTAIDGNWYIFTETSGGVAQGDSATIIAPIVDVSALTTPVMSFFYHMWGADMGTLNIDVEDPVNSGNWVNAWSLSGDQGNQWHQGFVDLTSFGTEVRVRFTGIDDVSYTSDIALDSISFEEAPPADASIIDISTVDDGCGLGSGEQVSVEISNNSVLPISNFQVSFTVDGISMVTETYTGTIDGFDTDVYTFSGGANLSAPGTHEIAGTVWLGGDADPSNDSDTTEVLNQPTITMYPYTMGFEMGPGGWVGEGVWELGAPAGGVINSAGGGTESWVTDLVDQYGPNELDALISPCFDFSGLVGDPIFSADIWYDYENNWDGAIFEASTDNGATWNQVGSIADPNWYNNTNANGPLIGIDCWNGNSGSWVNVSLELAGMAGESNVKFRFLHVTDGSVFADGLGVDNINIVEGCPPSLMLVSTSTDELQAGALDGTVDVMANGGVGPYMYMWNTMDTTAMVSGLAAGTYHVTVTDANGCMDTDSVMVGTFCPADLGLTAEGTDESTPGSNDGSATVTATGGTGPYGYTWDNGGIMATITGLAPGTYYVTVTDANGCTDSDSAVVSTLCPDNLGLSTGSNPEIGDGSADGTATVTASSGAAPYTYLWSNGSTNQSATGLTGDSTTYTVTVTDANGCTDVASVMVVTVYLTNTDNISSLSNLFLAPNPTHDATNLKLTFDKAVDVEVSIVDALGRVLQTRNRSNATNVDYDFDLSDYPGGVYFVRISADNQVMAKRIVLMK